MTSRKFDARIRVNISERAHTRLSAIAESKNMGLADYCALVLEGVDDDFAAFHAYNASKHATLAVYMLTIMMQLDHGKQLQSEVLAQLGKHVHASVGPGPGRPRFDGDASEVDPDVFVDALTTLYRRFVADRFPDKSIATAAL